jgi:hypothetical protein
MTTELDVQQFLDNLTKGKSEHSAGIAIANVAIMTAVIFAVRCKDEKMMNDVLKKALRCQHRVSRLDTIKKMLDIIKGNTDTLRLRLLEAAYSIAGDEAMDSLDELMKLTEQVSNAIDVLGVRS